MNREAIQLNQVSKIYNGEYKVVAVNNIDLVIEKGAFCCIAGPSGSGKTSLLNLIGGLDRPTSGKIIVDGEDITRFNNAKLSDFRLRKLGFIFQELNLIPVLTVRENIEFPLLLRSWTKERRKAAVNDIIEKLGLSNIAERRPSAISGGQQQRVAVARAVIPNPAVILADEPTANLDSANTAILIDLLKRMNAEKKVTFILSTHDELVLKEALQTIYLRDGKITNGGTK